MSDTRMHKKFIFFPRMVRVYMNDGSYYVAIRAFTTVWCHEEFQYTSFYDGGGGRNKGKWVHKFYSTNGRPKNQ